MAESTEITLSRIDQNLSALVLSHKELKSEIKPIIDDVQRIKIHLYADDFTGSAGVIKTVREHALKIEQLEKGQFTDKKVMAAWASAFGLAGSLILKLLTWLFVK